MRFLLFTLYAPMGAFGEVAVGERRMGWARPARSAVFGLVAAAQGIVRSDEDSYRTLEQGLHFAVRVDFAGRPFVDYHTTQTPKARRGRRYATRRHELESGDLYTVLSSREWRSDTCFTAALWAREGGLVDLDEIREALRHPQFVLYMGRKAAPLGLPLDPTVIEAGNLTEAFEKRQPDEIVAGVLELIRDKDTATYEIAFDARASGVPDTSNNARQERRRDAVVSRTRWQFTYRHECIIASPRGTEK